MKGLLARGFRVVFDVALRIGSLWSLHASLIVVAILVACLANVDRYVMHRAREVTAEDFRRTETVLGRLLAESLASLKQTGLVIADVPKMKGALETRDPATVTEVAESYSALLGADLFVAADARGELLAYVLDGRGLAGTRAVEFVRPAVLGDSAETIVAMEAGLFRTAVLPVTMQGEVTGVLAVGRRFDRALADTIRDIAGCEVVFWSAAPAGGEKRLVATSLRETSEAEFVLRWPESRTSAVEFTLPRIAALPSSIGAPAPPELVMARTLALAGGDGAAGRSGCLLIKTLAPHLAFQSRVRAGLLAIGATAFLLTFVFGLSLETLVRRY